MLVKATISERLQQMAAWWKQFLAWRRKVVEETGGAPYIDVSAEDKESMNADHEGEKKGGWLTRWRQPRRQEKQLATLQEGFNELVGLTQSIREHMQQQARTQATLVEMMEHLPGAVESLKGVGEATKQQTETLGLLKQQLEAGARNEDHMMESMRSFNKTLALMDDLSKSTSQTVSSMSDRTRDSEDMLRTILERSERRLIYMIVTVTLVTLTVLGVGLYIGFGQRADAPTLIVPIEEEQLIIPDESHMDEEDATAAFEYQKSISELGDWPEEEVEQLPADEHEAIEPTEEVPPVDPDEILAPEPEELEAVETGTELIEPVELIPAEETMPAEPIEDEDHAPEAEEIVEEITEEPEADDDDIEEDTTSEEEEDQGNGDEVIDEEDVEKEYE